MIETPDVYAVAYPAEAFGEDGFVRADSVGSADSMEKYTIWLYHIKEKHGADYDKNRASYSLLPDDNFETIVALFKYRRENR